MNYNIHIEFTSLVPPLHSTIQSINFRGGFVRGGRRGFGRGRGRTQTVAAASLARAKRVLQTQRQQNQGGERVGRGAARSTRYYKPSIKLLSASAKHGFVFMM